jgi:hypothetical protein
MSPVAKVVGVCVAVVAAAMLVNLTCAAAGVGIGFLSYRSPPEIEVKYVLCHADREPRCPPPGPSSAPLLSAPSRSDEH